MPHRITISALPWYLQPFKAHPKISVVILGPGVVLTKNGLLCRVHLVGNDYNVDNNRSKHKGSSRIKILCGKCSYLPWAHAFFPRLVSCAAACYMGALCKSDSGSSSYGSFISVEGFLRLHRLQKSLLQRELGRKEEWEEKKYSVFNSFCCPESHKPPLNILFTAQRSKKKTHQEWVKCEWWRINRFGECWRMQMSIEYVRRPFFPYYSWHCTQLTLPSYSCMFCNECSQN